MIRTRFAPSPTGFLHIGGARTALFSWAFARANQGKFILRIEDTDLERSTQESVDSILDAMKWLDLDYDEGPFYQTKRFDRYNQVVEQLLTEKKAYKCYCSKEELDTMREEQKSRGEKPRYDRRCLHNPVPKSGVVPVVRFLNPSEGSVVWHDMVKGDISVANSELDDLIIRRSDGSPTYNFCVVVDDLDMQITQVIRGDDHVNNTPRQINILQALGAAIPQYAHVPMILRDDGQKMSKRTDAVSVMQYQEMGILPEALLNYLSRLCWGHGDEEVFTMEQFVAWFGLDHISPSPARFDIKKLYWVNSEHIKMTTNDKLASLITPRLVAKGINISRFNLLDIIELCKTRADNLNTLAAECEYFYQPYVVSIDDATKHLSAESQQVLAKFADKLANVSTFDLVTLKVVIKEFCTENTIKMPQLGMPLRLKLCGITHTPSFDQIMVILGKSEVLARLK